MLSLQITKRWYDLIRAKVKKEDYRDIKPYYNSRLDRFVGQHILICFKNGYRANSPTMICKCFVTVDQGRIEWGAENEMKFYYVLKVEKIY